MAIHPTAIISPDAKLADDVEVGAYSIIGAGVELGPRCKVGPHVVINGPSRIGADNTFFQFASIGDAPQDHGYKGEATRLSRMRDRESRYHQAGLGHAHRLGQPVPCVFACGA
jgi:UDP-N-acetylglucosamine acyltransferase